MKRVAMYFYTFFTRTTLSNSAGCKYPSFARSSLKIASLQHAIKLHLLTRYIFKLSLYVSKKNCGCICGCSNQLLELVTHLISVFFLLAV